jgi:hypothetical protein
MPAYVHLTVIVDIPDTDRDKQLRLHVLENFRDNWLDAVIFDERSSTSGFGQNEYNRMIETLGREDLLTKENLFHITLDHRRLSQLGKAYLKYLEQQDVPQVVVPVAPLPTRSTQPIPVIVSEPTKPIHVVIPATPKPWWRNFWRKDVAIIAGIVGTIAMVAIAFIQYGAG